MLWAIQGLLLAGCQGDDLREIPMWQDGVLIQGDCPEEVAAVDQVGSTVTIYKDVPYLAFDEPLPGDYGAIAKDEPTFNNLMTDLYFGSWGPVDFSKFQVGFAWVRSEESCGYEYQEIHVNTKKDGGSVLDVTLLDPALGCDTPCTGDPGQYLVIESFPNDEPGSVCIRVKPGCE